MGCSDDPGAGNRPLCESDGPSEWSDDPIADYTAAEPSPGQGVTCNGDGTVAGYRILSVLGEGGMGIVWEAEHEQTNQRVALKVMRAEHVVDERHRRTFRREAEALARLEHPNIAALYDSGHTDAGHDFFSMEVVQGPTLDLWLAGRPHGLDADELKRRLRLFSTVCDAVHYAHERGVIHRDLKPSNIVISDPPSSPVDDDPVAADPTAKILDFGLASLTDSDLEATTRSEIGIIKGTLQYMSPEQARCDGETIGVRSDVYALGVMLYELLVGRRPYDVSISALAEALRAICEQRPRPLRYHWVGPARLDADLVTIVEKALEKDVDRRYATVADLGQDIESHLRSEPIAARPRSAAYRLRDHMAPTLEPVVEGAAIATVAVGNAVVSTAQGISRVARYRVWEVSPLTRLIATIRNAVSKTTQPHP